MLALGKNKIKSHRQTAGTPTRAGKKTKGGPSQEVRPHLFRQPRPLLGRGLGRAGLAGAHGQFLAAREDSAQARSVPWLGGRAGGLASGRALPPGGCDRASLPHPRTCVNPAAPPPRGHDSVAGIAHPGCACWKLPHRVPRWRSPWRSLPCVAPTGVPPTTP